MNNFSNEEMANKRTISITVCVTEFERKNVDGVSMTSVFCEYWQNGQLYIFKSVPTPYNLQLAVGDSIEVFVDPEDFSNYYVSINAHIIYKEIEPPKLRKEKYKKKYSRTARGHVKYEDFYSDEEMEDVSLIKLLFCLAVLGIVYSISNNSINPLVGLVLIIVAGIAEQKMEAMIVGKERTSLKIENAYISDEMMWWYEHKKLLYVGLILLHLYCVYTYLCCAPLSLTFN